MASPRKENNRAVSRIVPALFARPISLFHDAPGLSFMDFVLMLLRPAESGTPKRRKVLREPGRPIALRREYVSEQNTSLVLYPSGGSESAYAYKVRDEDSRAIFTVTGRKFGSSACREVWDQTGLPLFDIHREWSFRSVTWRFYLPGSSKTPLMTCRRLTSGDRILTFENAVATEGKDVEERTLTIHIEKHGRALARFDVVDGDRKIMEIHESIRHNKKLALLPGRKAGWRPAIDMAITPGVDISLVSPPLCDKCPHSEGTISSKRTGCRNRGDDIRLLLSRKSMSTVCVWRFC